MPEKPNIIFVECDSMDGRVMSCMKHLAAYTPNLDQLADRGVLFANTYCNSPQCCPSRASRWSGKHTHEIEGWNNYKGIEKNHSTYLDHLQKAGYRTQVYGKTDYLSGSHSLGARVFSWTRAANIRLAQKGLPTDKMVCHKGNIERVHTSDWKRIDQSLEWLQRNADKGEPIFLNCSLGAPHPAFVTSEHWLEKIDYDRVALPIWEETMHPVMDYMSATKNCLIDFPEEDILQVRQTYYAMVAEVDAMVGHIFRAVRDMGLEDNTYIIFASDHGEMNMEHRQYLKNALYEASARVPLIISGPDVQEGEAIQDLVSLIDLYPTLMDMAGLRPPKDLSGYSLMPHLTKKPAGHPDWVLSQYHSNFSNTGIFMLRQDHWKYVAYPGYEPQLFDLVKDRNERTNLAESEPEQVKKMDTALRKIVNYPKVDNQAKDYDREAFLKWQRKLGKRACRKTLATLFSGKWTDEHTQQLENWLAA